MCLAAESSWYQAREQWQAVGCEDSTSLGAERHETRVTVSWEKCHLKERNLHPIEFCHAPPKYAALVSGAIERRVDARDRVSDGTRDKRERPRLEQPLVPRLYPTVRESVHCRNEHEDEHRHSDFVRPGAEFHSVEP